MAIFLSLKYFTACFLHGIIDWVFKYIPVRNGREVKLVRVRTEWGVVASVNLRTIGGGGSIFAIVVRTYYLNEPYEHRNRIP